jgi:ribosomal protein S18 acetylase RimI-like enzyme
METRDRLVHALTLDDVDEVERVHRAAFPHAALTQLGKEAVCRYYRWLLTGPHEMYACGARVDGVLAGFCFGGIAPTAMPDFVRNNGVLLSRKLAMRPWLIVDPMFRHRLQRGFQALFRRRRVPLAPMPDGRKRPYDILSIAVHPDWQGEGIGRLLMLEAQATARQNGFHVMTLMVHTDNEQAIGFYESLGWRKLLMNGAWRGNMENWLTDR